MIFCYAWTNYLLINMVNVKVNFFANEKADLIIKSSRTIDEDIVEIVKSMNIFENIYFDDYVSFRRKGVKGLVTLRKKYKGHYARFVASLDKKNIYDKVLVAGYWNEVLYMLDALWKRGDRFNIDLVEEGELSYEETWKLFRPYIGNSRRADLFHKLNTFFLKYKFNRRLTKNLFLYSPEREEDKQVKAVRMPKMDQSNPVFEVYQRLYESLPDWKKLYYIKRKVIFISNYLTPDYYEDSNMYAYRIIDTILESVKGTNVIIKAHTSNTEHRLKFAHEYETNPNLYIDRDVYIFESLFCDSEMENKILIAKNSSVLDHPVSIFGKEPYIFLLYKLYPWYKNFGDEVSDQYAESLRKLYSKQEKIFVPNTILEFEIKLKELYYSLL